MPDDLAGLTESQRKVLKVVEAKSRRLIDEALGSLKRDAAHDVQTHVDRSLASMGRRVTRLIPAERRRKKNTT